MYRVTDVNPVFLSCQIENGALVLAHAGTPLENGELEIKLVEMNQTAVTIVNFEHDGTLYRVNAFTRASDGSLTAWERTSEGVRSPALSAVTGEVAVYNAMVTPVSYSPSGAVTARELAAFEEEPAYTPAAVKIRLPPPEDSKPGD